MRSKPVHIKLLDNFLMAPYPVMDQDGNDARIELYSGAKKWTATIANALQQPVTKATALASALTTAIYPNNIPEVVIFAVCGSAGAYITHKLTDNFIKKSVLFGNSYKPYYIVPEPAHHHAKTLSPSTIANVRFKKRLAKTEISVGLPCAIAPQLAMSAILGSPFTGVLFATFCSIAYGGIALSQTYRANRIINGDWTAHEEMPPERKAENETSKTPAFLQPALS